MIADSRFVGQPKHFWANIRSISQHLGYTERSRTEGAGRIKVPSLESMALAMEEIGLRATHLVVDGGPTELALRLRAYFEYRARVLDVYVEPRLMDKDRAQREFAKLKKQLKPKCPLPMNKQKGDKRAVAYFTGIVNMLIEAHAEGLSCDFSPRSLTTITRDGAPLRTLARWVDGAFPGPVNPISVWEIKEYYYTTTFGSRVADGVYETLLDGMEIEELREHERIDVKHYLMIDDHFTWRECGKSYLCRIVDMLHMGYVDEVLFGFEVIERLPKIVRSWCVEQRRRTS